MLSQPNSPSASRSSFLSPTSTTFALSDSFKPHSAEATVRLRNNGLGLLVLLLVMQLSPLPSILTAISVVASYDRAEAPSLWMALCTLGVLGATMLSVNLIQALYAVKYPRTTYIPISTPHKAFPKSPVPQQRARKLVNNPTAPSPQQQRFTSSYAPSPVSTPSRTLHYKIPQSATSPLNASLQSSTMSLPPTPSPVLSAYRGKHTPAVGRGLDNSLIGRLANNDSDDE